MEFCFNEDDTVSKVCDAFKKEYGVTLRVYKNISCKGPRASSTDTLESLSGKNCGCSITIEGYTKVSDIERQFTWDYIGVRIANADDTALLDKDYTLYSPVPAHKYLSSIMYDCVRMSPLSKGNKMFNKYNDPEEYSPKKRKELYERCLKVIANYRIPDDLSELREITKHLIYENKCSYEPPTFNFGGYKDKNYQKIVLKKLSECVDLYHARHNGDWTELSAAEKILNKYKTKKIIRVFIITVLCILLISGIIVAFVMC